jgi:hypothetical protein
MLKRMKMAKAISAQPAENCHTAEIIPFPEHRIVRRFDDRRACTKLNAA